MAEKYNVNLITDEGIKALVSYIDYFESTEQYGEYSMVENGSIGCSTLSERASEFYKAVYEHKFVQPFNWDQWIQNHRQLVHSDSGIESLDLEGLGKLLTTHFRKDRFCDGHLLSVMKNGHMLRILKCLKQLAEG